MDTILIRPIASSDQDAVVSIYKNCWLHTYPNEEYCIDKPAVEAAVSSFKSTSIHNNKFVAEIEGVVVGVISVKIGDVYTIQSLYVSTDYQRQGIGTALMQFIFNKFGNGTYELQVAVYNKQAIAFYKKYDFEIVADSLKIAHINNLDIPQITMRKVL